MGKSTPTAAILGELGRYPLELQLKLKKVLWWDKVQDSPSLYVQDCLQLGEEVNLPWFRHLKDILAEARMSHFKPLPATYSDREQKLYAEEWLHVLRRTSKLDSYSSYKTSFNISTYLQHIHVPCYRTALTKLRTTNHNLEIELGRRTGTPQTERHCRLCQTGQAETEKHLLTECPAYELMRFQFVNSIDWPESIVDNHQLFL